MTTPSLEHHQTAQEDRLPFKEKIGFALGGLGNPGGAIGMLSNPIFVMELGVNPALLSTFGFISTIISSFVGPIAGQKADNFRTPWGRRRPLIVLTGIPMVLFYSASYAFPNGMSTTGLAVWGFSWGLLALIPMTVYNLSLGALVTESVRDYHERVRLGTFITFFSLSYGFLLQWLYPLIKNALHPLVIPFGKTHLTLLKFPHFSDPITGARWVILICGIFSLVCSQLPALLCPEKRYAQVKKSQAKGKLIPSLKEALKNRECLIICSIRFFTFFCYSVVGSLGFFMNTYFVFGGDKTKGSLFYGFLGSSYIVVASLSLIFYRWLEPKMGKMKVLRIAAGILMAGCVCKLFVYQPSMPWLQLIVLMANGFSVTGLQIMTGSMLGDVVDYDELLHNKRREALFGSIFDWAMGQGSSLGGLLCGFILVWIGFNAKLAGPQSWLTLHLMQFFYFFFPFCGALFAFVMIGRYKLTEGRMYEIRDELKKRHAEEKAAEDAGALLASDGANA